MAVTPVVASAARPDTTEPPAPTGSGGELIDLGTFALGAPDNIDPALNQTLDAYQVINAMGDGLTDIDTTDPENSVIVPLLAESYESSEDASVWTFTLKEGLQFADGEEILPSTFVRSWERAVTLAGPYSTLFNKIAGGAEMLAGEADTLSGVVADDAALTLTVTLSAPDADFDAIAGFQIFFPVPVAADEAGDQYDRGEMVGNGPYTLESPRTDEEIVLIRNDNWGGDFNGETWPDRPERIILQVSADAETAYNALEAGEADTARIPSGRTADAQASWGTTSEITVLGSYYFYFDERDAIVGGPENLLLRQAISQSIDREAINTAVFDGARVVATGITPPGIPGFAPDLCEFCGYDPAAAQAAFDEWTAAGNSQSEPIPIQHGTGGVHEEVVQLIIENLAAIGIEAVPEPMDSTTYFDEMTAGDCVFCRSGWISDYPTYANWMWDNFHGINLGPGNNFGYENEEFDALVDEAISTVDGDQQGALFREAEQILLNTDIGVVPLLWYTGDYAFNQERLTGFTQSPLMLIPWEQITINE